MKDGIFRLGIDKDAKFLRVGILESLGRKGFRVWESDGKLKKMDSIEERRG